MSRVWLPTRFKGQCRIQIRHACPIKPTTSKQLENALKNEHCFEPFEFVLDVNRPYHAADSPTSSINRKRSSIGHHPGSQAGDSPPAHREGLDSVPE